MSRKCRSLWNTLGILVLAVALLSPGGPFRPAAVEAAGISLRPPFSGTFRISSFFDHTYPNLVNDGQITIYNGESTPDCNASPNGPYCYAGHDGIDWPMDAGTPVLAAADGAVLRASWHGGYGNQVVLSHGSGYYTMYAHLQGFNVVVGQSVLAGDLLAWSDNTGSGSKGNHLHFSVYKGGYDSFSYDIDPFGWRGNGPDPLKDWGAGVGSTSECLWRGLPGDAISCFDHIVEDHRPNDGGGWSHGGWWDNDGDSDDNGGNGWWNRWTNSETYRTSWAQWNAQAGGFNAVSHVGYYRILAWIPACVDSRTTQAKYHVYHWPYQQTTVTVNQSAVSNNWTDLGTFRLDLASSYHYVDLDDFTGDGHWVKKVAADSIKFSAELTYLPAIVSGWTTYVEITNVTNSVARGAVNWYTRDGSLWTYQTFEIPKKGRDTKIVSTLDGSAVVVSDQDVVVTVRREKNNRVTAYTGVSEVARGTGWGEPGVTVYIPVVIWNAWGWRSTLYVQNTAAAQANFTITYCKHDTTNCQNERTIATPTVLNPFGSQAYTAQEEEGDNYYGYAKITSDQPLAVVVTQEHDSIGASDYNAFVVGAPVNYLPSLMNNWQVPSPPARSSFTVQNLGTTVTDVQIHYVEDNPDHHTTDVTYPSLAAGASVIIVQWDPTYGVHDNWHGSARLTSSNGQPLAAIVNQEQTNTHQSYSSFIGGGSIVYGPFAGWDYAYGGYTYDSASEVMNLSTASSTDVTRYYYNTSGVKVKETLPQSIGPERVFTFYVPNEGVSSGYGGMVRIMRSGSNPLAAIHNFIRKPQSYDYGASYNMPWRY